MIEKRLTPRDIAEIVKMRGLGYSQAEIAQQLGVSQSAIQYQLSKINERARNEGNDDTFLALIIGASLGIGVGLLFAKLLEKGGE
ncbi:MAG: helix-turn-helix domain-containing protein [Theionarchaea archaeon]|nr:helix-turn-helix domain-containing protein [Theionarchaea archaeon]